MYPKAETKDCMLPVKERTLCHGVDFAAGCRSKQQVILAHAVHSETLECLPNTICVRHLLSVHLNCHMLSAWFILVCELYVASSVAMFMISRVLRRVLRRVHGQALGSALHMLLLVYLHDDVAAGLLAWGLLTPI